MTTIPLHEDYLRCPECSRECPDTELCGHEDPLCIWCCETEHPDGDQPTPAGLYPDRPEDEYRSDMSALSASEAKVLLGKKPPGDDKRDALDFGTAFHSMLLGGPEITWIDHDSWRSQAARDARAEAVTADTIPLLTKDRERLDAMADAVKTHPVASRLLEAATHTECSAYAEHAATGAMVRGRFDLLGPGYIADLKTTADADPRRFGKTVADFMYHVSAANYLDIARGLGLDVDAFGFVNVEKTAPYRVSVCELTDEAVDVGRDLMREACELWLAAGHRVELPAFGDGIHRVDLPKWAYFQHENNYQETA